MTLTCRWGILLVILWIQVGLLPGMHCKDGSVGPVSVEDILLLKDEPNPKCFARTEADFTCFFETADNRTCDFFYSVNRGEYRKDRCEMTVQRTEKGTFLHICSFPKKHVFLYINIHLEVVECSNNSSLYTRTVSVEDNFLIDPPFNVSLHQNGQVGQLQVSWGTKASIYMEDELWYRIRYTSRSLGEKTKEAQVGIVLDSLVPGEEVEVQVTVKCAGTSDAGHWSSWSHPVRAVVPQSADDISLMCYTSDMQTITCQWNGSRYGVENKYKLFYKMEHSDRIGWTEWTECGADMDSADQCFFHGDKSRKVRVRLSSSHVPLSRTFYTQEFTLDKCIKTSPPSDLRLKAHREKKLCLKWETPLPSLSAHLEYEVRYQIRGGQMLMKAFVKGPNTSTCLDVSTGGQYSIKSRARPVGPIYTGYWSDWSDELTVTGNTPVDTGLLLLLFIPVLMLMTAIFLITLFRTYLSKLKLYVWPPVPNPDKVLQDFFAEINRQKQNPLLPAKQFIEETTSSVVEIMSEKEISGLRKPSEESSQLLSLGRSFSIREQMDGSAELEDFPDYVTLNKDSIIHCQKGNKFVPEEFEEKEDLVVKDELFQTCHSSCTDCSVSTPPSPDNDFLNHSYLPLDELADKFKCKVNADRGPGNLYTNFPCG